VKLQGDDGKEHTYIVKPDGSKQDLGVTKPEGGSYSGTGLQQQNYSVLDRLHDSIVTGNASDADKRQYSRAYNDLQKGSPVAVQDPNDKSKVIMVPGQPTDLTGYAPPPYRDTSTAPSRPATAEEKKDAGWARRMELANETVEKIGQQSFGDVLAGKVPLAGNFLTTPEGQQYRTAAEAWVWAKLRQESGAAVPVAEAENYFRTYFPQPGDSAANVELKRRLRELETDSMRRSAGNAYTAPAAPTGGTGTGGSGGGGGGGRMPPEGSVIKQGGKSYKIINGQAVEQ
jgi:hypothetical protein